MATPLSLKLQHAIDMCNAKIEYNKLTTGITHTNKILNSFRALQLSIHSTESKMMVIASLSTRIEKHISLISAKLMESINKYSSVPQVPRINNESVSKIYSKLIERSLKLFEVYIRTNKSRALKHLEMRESAIKERFKYLKDSVRTLERRLGNSIVSDSHNEKAEYHRKIIASFGILLSGISRLLDKQQSKAGEIRRITSNGVNTTMHHQRRSNQNLMYRLHFSSIANKNKAINFAKSDKGAKTSGVKKPKDEYANTIDASERKERVKNTSSFTQELKNEKKLYEKKLEKLKRTIDRSKAADFDVEFKNFVESGARKDANGEDEEKFGNERGSTGKNMVNTGNYNEPKRKSPLKPISGSSASSKHLNQRDLDKEYESSINALLEEEKNLDEFFDDASAILESYAKDEAETAQVKLKKFEQAKLYPFSDMAHIHVRLLELYEIIIHTESLITNRLVEGFLVVLSRGSLENDKRFLDMMDSTISGLEKYDTPDLAQFNIQFVIAKKYVEDVVEIKEKTCLSKYFVNK